MASDGFKFVGNVKDGQMNGQVVVVMPDCSATGEIKNGRIIFRTLTMPDGTELVGKCDENGTGRVTVSEPNGNKYIGEFKKGKMHGQGALTWSTDREGLYGSKNTFYEGKNVGEFKSNKIHNGAGTETFES